MVSVLTESLVSTVEGILWSTIFTMSSDRWINKMCWPRTKVFLENFVESNSTLQYFSASRTDNLLELPSFIPNV